MDSIGVVTEGTTLLTIKLSGLKIVRFYKYKYPHASLVIVKSCVTVGHFNFMGGKYFIVYTWLWISSQSVSLGP